jgi:glycosyltransferase involved in cell wall biosynthesis
MCKHIVVATQQFGSVISGVGTYANSLVNVLLDKGYAVTVICPTIPGSIVSKSNLEILQINKPVFKSAARWIPIAWSFSKVLQTYLRSRSPDLVYFIDARESVFTQTNVPMLGSIHDGYAASCSFNPFALRGDYADWISRWFYYHITAYLEAIAFDKFSFLHYVSDFTRNQIETRYKIRTDNITTIHIGLDTKRFPKAENIRPLEKRIPGKILTVGGNPERKGIHRLVRVLPEVKRRVPEVHLYIAGGDVHSSIVKTIASLGVQDSVTWLGWLDAGQLKQHYESASVFAMPSLVESLGLVYLEAAIYGTPVLASSNSGLVEVFGQSGALLSDPRDDEALVANLLDLLTNKALSKNLVEAALNIVHKRDIRDTVEEISRFLEQALSVRETS